MKKRFVIILTYILFFFNSYLFCDEKNNALKIGLLAPLTGEYKEVQSAVVAHAIYNVLNSRGSSSIYTDKHEAMAKLLSEDEKKRALSIAQDCITADLTLCIRSINFEYTGLK